MGIVIPLGYIEEKELFIVRFPFGDLWGDHGYGYLSYKYIIEMAMDLWIINIITKEKVENYTITDIPDESVKKYTFKCLSWFTLSTNALDTFNVVFFILHI